MRTGAVFNPARTTQPLMGFASLNPSYTILGKLDQDVVLTVKVQPRRKRAAHAVPGAV